jgi:hypothetical protein
MSEFSARRATARSSEVVASVVRMVTLGVPLAVLLEGDHVGAWLVALACGAADGWCRLWVTRSARSLVAESEGLLITSGSETRRVPWSDVTALQTWQRLNRVDYIAVHYRNHRGLTVATCWDQNAHEELVRFVHACARHVTAGTFRNGIELAGLRSPGVWRGVASRFVTDVAATVALGLACSLFREALAVGLIAASMSALLLSRRYGLRPAAFTRRTSQWYAQRSETLVRLTTLPASLTLWVQRLADAEGPNVLGNAVPAVLASPEAF